MLFLRVTLPEAFDRMFVVWPMHDLSISLQDLILALRKIGALRVLGVNAKQLQVLQPHVVSSPHLPHTTHLIQITRLTRTPGFV
jgi:hypothetical protein